MARLELANITKRYGEMKAVDDVSLIVEQGEFVVLLGPSGCGKTTTLRTVAGFVEPTSGTVRLGDSGHHASAAWKRNAGLVFQSYALFPHLTVSQNVAFGLEMRKVPAAETPAKIAEALRLVRLDHLGDRLPRQLSGGQQQRVALARALVFRPDILLLDEPLSNLDASSGRTFRVEIRELQRKLGLTTVMVTHDQEEALTMADRLVVMNEGRIRQVGSQQDLYERPADRFVADFVGRSTFLEGRVEAPGRFVSEGGLAIACTAETTGPAAIALRPSGSRWSTARAARRTLSRARSSSCRISARRSTSMCGSTRRSARGADAEPAGQAVAGDRQECDDRMGTGDREGLPDRLIEQRHVQQGERKDMSRIIRPNRRQIIGGAAAAGVAAAAWPGASRAQAKGRIVVGTWGGDYARLLNKNIDEPILKKAGWEVVQDQAGDPQRRSKMLAEARLPRGTSDVQALSALNMYQMHDAGTVLPVDYGKVKNTANLLPR